MLNEAVSKLARKAGIGAKEVSYAWPVARHILSSQVIIEVNGTKANFYRRTPAEFVVLYNLLGEKEMYSTVLDSVDSDDIFYDIGANIGIYACLAGVKGIDVVAVEPHPGNVESLQSNLNLNEIDAEVVEGAFSDTDGKISLNIDQGYGDQVGAFHHSIKTPTGRHKHREPAKVTVDGYRGDTIIKQRGLPTPDVMKIDVEGAAPEVLKGLSETLADGKCREIFCEPHGNISEIREIMESYDYNVDEIGTHLKEGPREEPHLWATLETGE